MSLDKKSEIKIDTVIQFLKTVKKEFPEAIVDVYEGEDIGIVIRDEDGHELYF